MQEVEHEGLIEALESIIIAFHEEISPFAIELAQRIVDYYLANCKDIAEGDDTHRSPMAYI